MKNVVLIQSVEGSEKVRFFQIQLISFRKTNPEKRIQLFDSFNKFVMLK